MTKLTLLGGGRGLFEIYKTFGPEKHIYNHDFLKGYAKLKQKQKLFQIDNGLRIHERGGAMDKVLNSLNI